MNEHVVRRFVFLQLCVCILPSVGLWARLLWHRVVCQAVEDDPSTHYSVSVDMYSFGVLMLQLGLVGALPCKNSIFWTRDPLGKLRHESWLCRVG